MTSALLASFFCCSTEDAVLITYLKDLALILDLSFI